MPDWGLTAALWAFGLGALYFLARFFMGWIRRALLMRRFGDAGVVATILEGRISKGMSPEMVVAAWGKPADVDEVMLKTKSKLEMKWDQKGKNRYGTRVYFENGEVVAWERK